MSVSKKVRIFIQSLWPFRDGYSTQLFVHVPLITTKNNDETFLKEFLVILKRPFHNFWKILWKCFLYTHHFKYEKISILCGVSTTQPITVVVSFANADQTCNVWLPPYGTATQTRNYCFELVMVLFLYE